MSEISVNAKAAKILLFVEKNAKCRPIQVARETGISPSLTVMIIAKLEQHGLVQCRRLPSYTEIERTTVQYTVGHKQWAMVEVKA